MNILSVLPFNSFENFLIRVNDIEDGWMDITIATQHKSFDYSVSYVTDPLNDLLEATVLLLTKQPIHFRAAYSLKDNAIVVHDLEGNSIVWFLNYSNSILTIAIWENMNTNLLEDLCHYNLDGETYKKNEFEDVPDLTENLLFALKGSPEYFAKTLIDTFKNLDTKYKGDEYKGHWGFSYSDINFKALSKYVATNAK